jgi:aspartyl-tRNA(Asn)/glutamyl-tRNA(Gln) amidotransferase subunit A
MLEDVMATAHAVRTRRISATDVVENALARIETRNADLGAFVAVDPAGARAQAVAIDRQIEGGRDPGPLAGVPIGVKDLEDAAGFVTTCGDPARRGSPPATADSVEVARLRSAGAIVVGKTNTPAYGFHAETDNLAFGPTRNPWSATRTSGGSSGGSAAAVAAGMVPLCTGSDGGGSIRIPSAVCGIAGFKPTNGIVPFGDADTPTWGPFSTRGPMARTFAEIAYALDVVAGYSPRDLTSFDLPGSFVEAAANATLDGVRIAWSPTLGIATPDADIVASCERALATLEAAGARVVEVVDSLFEEPPLHAWIMRAAPGSLRAAASDPGAWDDRLLPAAQLLASYGDKITAAQMLDGEQGAHRATLALAALFERVDVLVTPAMATRPPRVGEASPYGPGWASDFTVAFNLVRAPAAVVPCGFVDTDNNERLPLALQVVAPRCADLRLMRVASAAEAALGGVSRPSQYA